MPAQKLPFLLTLAPGLRVEDTKTAFFRCTVHGHLGYTEGIIRKGASAIALEKNPRSGRN